MRRARKGFTLIELMLAIAIIGLMLTVVFMRIESFLPSSRLQSSCRTLVGDIDKLRLASTITFQETVYLQYNLDEHGYRAFVPFEYDEDGNLEGPGETELIDFKRLPECVIFESISLGISTDVIEDANLITVLVNPDGSITGHIVHMKDEQYESEYSIRVASLTGFAEIIGSRVEYEEVDDGFF